MTPRPRLRSSGISSKLRGPPPDVNLQPRSANSQTKPLITMWRKQPSADGLNVSVCHETTKTSLQCSKSFKLNSKVIGCRLCVRPRKKEAHAQVTTAILKHRRPGC